MQYLGGKCKIAKPISELILQKKENIKTFVSLFCGGCAIETKLAPHFENVICNDLHPYLIAMYQALQNGYDLPENISEEQYRYIREHKDEDKALTGFVGFACSFGAKWFGGCARNKRGNNYAKQGRNAMKNTVFISELQAPDDFVCVWQKEILRTLNSNSKRPKSVEKLFVHKSQI